MEGNLLRVMVTAKGKRIKQSEISFGSILSHNTAVTRPCAVFVVVLCGTLAHILSVEPSLTAWLSLNETINQ